jgi:alkylated DNA repair protein (DNA oxidative demethylase)
MPGVVQISDWLDLERSARWSPTSAPGRAAGRPRHPRMPTGHLMSVQSVCLGWHWQPYTYSRTADDTDGAPVKALPAHIAELARAAVDASYGPGTSSRFTSPPTPRS